MLLIFYLDEHFGDVEIITKTPMLSLQSLRIFASEFNKPKPDRLVTDSDEVVENPVPGLFVVRVASSACSFLVRYQLIVTLCSNSSITLQLLNVVHQAKQLPL
jgi:hypothetical protein